MKYCTKCEKNTPTKKVEDTEECMVCGAAVLSGSKIQEKPIRFEEKATSLCALPKTQKESNPSPKTKTKDIADEYNNSGNSTYSSGGGTRAILGGIMIMIIGFFTLTVGSYIISVITESLSGVNYSGDIYSTSYTTQTSSVMSYVITVLPLFGLALLVFGFATILFALRSGLGSRYENY
jgi:hypothetical protein